MYLYFILSLINNYIINFTIFKYGYITTVSLNKYNSNLIYI